MEKMICVWLGLVQLCLSTLHFVIVVHLLEPEHWKFKTRKWMENQESLFTDGMVLALNLCLNS